MLGFPLGILSAAGAGGGAAIPAYELITTTVLGTATSSLTFSSLATYATDYKHLQVRYAVRSARTEINDGVRVRLNGATGSTYAHHSLRANGSSVSSSFDSQVALLAPPIPANSATSNAFGAGVIDLLDCYSTTKNTTGRALAGIASNYNELVLQSGVYINTEAISSIELASSTSNNFVVGSRFSLYGVKG